MPALTPRQRAHLKALAHHLKPVVLIGKDGLSDAVVHQIDTALADHELIKVKLGEGAPLDRKEALAALPGATGAEVVQNLGRNFVLYRADPEKPRITLPAPREA
jgi:RNA-binding protein